MLHSPRICGFFKGILDGLGFMGLRLRGAQFLWLRLRLEGFGVRCGGWCGDFAAV